MPQGPPARSMTESSSWISRPVGSPAHQLFVELGIAGALQLDLRGGFFKRAHIVRREFDICGAEIFFQPGQLRGPWNRNDPRLLRQQPGERNLRGRRLLLFANEVSRSTRAWLALRFSGVKARERCCGNQCCRISCLRRSCRSESLCRAG